ncbi:MAG: DUF4332 domain-containing protein [Anaerolineae bacterium]|nr:DUF4332 domain-containing protein [Anaerolineae bacterium]
MSSFQAGVIALVFAPLVGVIVALLQLWLIPESRVNLSVDEAFGRHGHAHGHAGHVAGAHHVAPDAHAAEAAHPAPIGARPEAYTPPVAHHAEPPAAAASPVHAPDDLKRIEGIGPKISDVLATAGITTFAQLAQREPAELEQIVKDGGVRLAFPASWPAQARLAAAGDWDALQELQDNLKGGR